MDLETIREFCLGLPGSTEDIKWDDVLCFMVANKIFLMCLLTSPHQINLKCEQDEFGDLVSRDGVQQASHMARGQWIELGSPEVMSQDELQARILKSRSLVISKLPKKQQAAFV